jgi:hypothetical protein
VSPHIVRITSVKPYVHVGSGFGDYIDFDEHQRQDINRMITVLNACADQYPPATSLAAGVQAAMRRTVSRKNVLAEADAYRASVTKLVMQGNLNIEQGEHLNAIIDDLVASLDLS